MSMIDETIKFWEGVRKEADKAIKGLKELKKNDDGYSEVSLSEQRCLWNGMPETSPGSGIKIGGLSCPCPKCSPRC